MTNEPLKFQIHGWGNYTFWRAGDGPVEVTRMRDLKNLGEFATLDDAMAAARKDAKKS